MVFGGGANFNSKNVQCCYAHVIMPVLPLSSKLVKSGVLHFKHSQTHEGQRQTTENPDTHEPTRKECRKFYTSWTEERGAKGKLAKVSCLSTAETSEEGGEEREIRGARAVVRFTCRWHPHLSCHTPRGVKRSWDGDRGRRGDIYTCHVGTSRGHR